MGPAAERPEIGTNPPHSEKSAFFACADPGFSGKLCLPQLEVPGFVPDTGPPLQAGFVFLGLEFPSRGMRSLKVSAPQDLAQMERSLTGSGEFSLNSGSAPKAERPIA